MKLIFAGTPEFAAVALAALYAAGHEVVLVLSQPDRPAGRGMKLQASPVKLLALQYGSPVLQPRSLRLDGKYPEDAAAARQAIEAANADAMVVAAYGLILPKWVLSAPRLGCFNIHASLLPRWRGAAPIHRAIEAGDAQTGVTIMQMDAGLDTGDMLLTGVVPISPSDTTGTLHDRLAALGEKLIVRALDLAANGTLQAVPQPSDGITYAHKIEKSEAAIDWSQPATTICQRVRAFNPFPGATLVLDGDVHKVWSAYVKKGLPTGSRVYGEIVALSPDGIEVSAMNSIVVITQLQRPGGKRLSSADFLRGNPWQLGQVLR